MKRTLGLPCILEVVKRIYVMLMLLTSKTDACMQGIMDEEELDLLSMGLERFGEPFRYAFPRLVDLRRRWWGFWLDHLLEFYDHGVLRETQLSEAVINEIRTKLEKRGSSGMLAVRFRRFEKWRVRNPEHATIQS